MFRRGHRAAARARASQRERERAEADRLLAQADQLDSQLGNRPGYQPEIRAERAARIRAMLAADLVRDASPETSARAEPVAFGPKPGGYEKAITPDLMPGAAADRPVRSREDLLQGAELDAEIERLAVIFPEPGPVGESTDGAEVVAAVLADAADTVPVPEVEDRMVPLKEASARSLEPVDEPDRDQVPGPEPFAGFAEPDDVSGVQASVKATLPDRTPEPEFPASGWHPQGDLHSNVRQVQAEPEAEAG